MGHGGAVGGDARHHGNLLTPIPQWFPGTQTGSPEAYGECNLPRAPSVQPGCLLSLLWACSCLASWESRGRAPEKVPCLTDFLLHSRSSRGFFRHQPGVLSPVSLEPTPKARGSLHARHRHGHGAGSLMLFSRWTPPRDLPLLGDTSLPLALRGPGSLVGGEVSGYKTECGVQARKRVPEAAGP